MLSSQRRLTMVAALQIAVVMLVILQLARLQIWEHSYLREIAIRSQWHPRLLKAPRGQIWDRNHTLLVGNMTRYQVAADPQNIVDKNRAIEALAPVLGMNVGDLRAQLVTTTHIVLASGLPRQTGIAVNELGVWAVYARPYWQRAYPEGQLAAHVLGFMDANGLGYYGVEGYYDDRLRGQTITVTLAEDVWLGLSPFDFYRAPEPQPGVDLVLTIDRTFQALAEAELGRALADTGAQRGTIIVMDPRSGEILALANLPTFDPNAYPTTPAELFTNPAISAMYEPGSVFKILTMGVALQTGTAQPDSWYNDVACAEFGGQLICNWDRHGHGASTMVDLLAYSSNVGAATLATRMGAQAFYRGIQAFGIGQPTGIDLQGEARGSLRVPGDPDWHESDLATNAFGQGLAVTPIQMIAAVAAVANDGALMRPHVVRQMIEGDQVRTAQPTVLARPLSVETARTLTAMLAQAIEREVPQAQVPGYRIAGKTGTAQIPIPGGYDDPWTIASFVGYGPVSDPRLVILVKLDRPTVSPYGSTTAAPVFKRLAARMFILMGIPPES